jgi:hypothetical protein
MLPNEFTKGVDAMAKVALATLQQVLEDRLGPIDEHTLARQILEEFEIELMGRV